MCLTPGIISFAISLLALALVALSLIIMVGFGYSCGFSRMGLRAHTMLNAGAAGSVAGIVLATVLLLKAEGPKKFAVPGLLVSSLVVLFLALFFFSPYPLFW